MDSVNGAPWRELNSCAKSSCARTKQLLDMNIKETQALGSAAPAGCGSVTKEYVMKVLEGACPVKDASKVKIMGIINVTGDSFYKGSRTLDSQGRLDEALFRDRLMNMVEAGADIIDLGACSTRPGSVSVPAEEEWLRLSPALRIFNEMFPDIVLSIDTFRPEVVSRAYDMVGKFIVNDVSGGSENMWRTVGELGLPYVAMHTRGTPENMQELTDYDDVTAEVLHFFYGIAETAERHGVKDWILDPGFGFAKTVEQNWKLLLELETFKRLGRPILAGLSRKSFICKPLGLAPEQALEPTVKANLLAVAHGADILRVHDVSAMKSALNG